MTVVNDIHICNTFSTSNRPIGESTQIVDKQTFSTNEKEAKEDGIKKKAWGKVGRKKIDSQALELYLHLWNMAYSDTKYWYIRWSKYNSN